MSIRLKYITTLLVAGAAATATAAAPTTVAAPASAQPAGIATAPMDGHGWGGGDHGLKHRDRCNNRAATPNDDGPISQR